LLALLSELTRSSPSRRGLLLPGFQRIGHPLRRRISLQGQLGKFPWQDFHLLEHQLASLHRSGSGYVVPHHHHLTGLMRPTHRHSSISPHCGLYALSSLCAIFPRLGDPRVDPCFRWHTLSTCRPPGPREVHRLHTPSSFTADAGLRPEGKWSRHFQHPHPPILVGGLFRGFTTVHFRCDLSICSPSCRS
jgi:hypothetical protein